MIRNALSLALSAALLTAGCASTPQGTRETAPSDPVAAVVEREQLLTNYLVRERRGVRSLLTDDFTCSMETREGQISPTGERHHLCTGMGHNLTERSSRPDWLVNAERTVPRMAEIENIEVTVADGVATAISTQVYRNWFPYDGSLERRSHVTDTWVIRDGSWQLHRRVSRPLEQSSAGPQT